MRVTIIQTEHDRHVENVLFGGAEPGDRMALCGVYLPGQKGVYLEQIPPAAVCAECVAVAREWLPASWFVPFDTVQRRRLLDNLDRDLAAVA